MVHRPEYPADGDDSAERRHARSESDRLKVDSPVNCGAHDTAKAFIGMVTQRQPFGCRGRTMHIRRIAAIAAVGSLLAGCAIHPVPEQVTGLRTEDIVKQIRCETRDAARDVILDFLKLNAEVGRDRKAQELYEKYSANRELMIDFNPDREFPGPFYDHTRAVFKLIYGAGVAYSFDLTMTETNDVGLTNNFLGSWQATLTMGLGADLNRTRTNRRTFTISDSFWFLLRELNIRRVGASRPYCDGHVAFGPNYIYPIAGKIGMYNPVRTFLQLSVFENLSTAKDLRVTTAVTGSPAMVEDLTFTTLVDLMPSPKFTFVQLKRGFEITDTALKGNFARKDVHQVTVGLALEAPGAVALAALEGFVFPGAISPARKVARGRMGAPAAVMTSVIGSPKTGAEVIALKAVDQRKSSEVTLRAAQ